MKRVLLPLLCLLALLVSSAHATVLIFTSTDFGGTVTQSYGDNVTATTMGSHSYGSTGGFTPNVTVTYANAAGSQTDIGYWGTGYSDLTDVAWYGNSGYQLIFNAASGYDVTLTSLSFGAWGGLDLTIPANHLKIFINGSSTPSYINDGASGRPGDITVSSASALSFNFGGTAQAGSTVSLFIAKTVDASDFTAIANLGLDNITFSQSVSAIPEPSTYAALAGAVMLGLAAWRRRSVGRLVTTAA